MSSLPSHIAQRTESSLRVSRGPDVDELAALGMVLGAICGWILDDNQGMNAIAEAIESHVNKQYLIYAKPL